MKKFIPDCYLPSSANGIYVSHEAVCVLNLNDADALVNMTLYFEDREKMSGFSAVIPAERTIHIRLDKITNCDGMPIPRDTPYAMVIESDLDVMVQYTRVDTTQPDLAMITAIL